MDNKGGDTMLGIGRALTATLQSVAQDDTAIIKAIGRAIHDRLNGVGDLDEQVVGSLGKATSKVNESCGQRLDTQLKTPLWVLEACSMTLK